LGDDLALQLLAAAAGVIDALVLRVTDGEPYDDDAITSDPLAAAGGASDAGIRWNTDGSCTRGINSKNNSSHIFGHRVRLQNRRSRVRIPQGCKVF
jgi:hypothetical protein